MSDYTPELGQMCFGNPTGEYEMPEYTVALFFGLWREIGRVYWNRNQEEFSNYGSDDPEIPGIVVNAYWWGADDTPESARPNFTFGDVEIRWYKYPGRGMSCNVDWEPRQWVEWFDACLEKIQGSDTDIGKQKVGG